MLWECKNHHFLLEKQLYFKTSFRHVLWDLWACPVPSVPQVKLPSHSRDWSSQAHLASQACTLASHPLGPGCPEQQASVHSHKRSPGSHTDVACQSSAFPCSWCCLKSRDVHNHFWSNEAGCTYSKPFSHPINLEGVLEWSFPHHHLFEKNKGQASVWLPRIVSVLWW